MRSSPPTRRSLWRHSRRRALNDKLVSEKEANLVSDFRERGIHRDRARQGSVPEPMKPVYADLDAKFGTGTVKTLLDLR